MLNELIMNQQNHQRTLRSEAGSVLLSSFMVVVLLTGAGLATLTTTSLNFSKTKNLMNERQAFYLAEAGLAHAKVALNLNIANWSSYATVSPQTLISSTSLSGLGSYKVTIQAASGPGLLMTATGTASDGTSTSVSSVVSIGYSNLTTAFVTGGSLTISGSPTIDGAAGSIQSNNDLTISGSPHIMGNANAVGTYGVQAPGAPVILGFAGGGQPAVSINNVTASTFMSSYDYYLRSNGSVVDANNKQLSDKGKWQCWDPTPAKSATKKDPATNAIWTLTCDTTVNGTFYVDGNVVISASVGTVVSPWITTILSNYSIHVTTRAASLYMRPPLPTDGSFYKSATQNLLFVASQDLWIEGTATQTFASGIARAYEQVAVSGNPTFIGLIVAQDSAGDGSLVTSNSISGNMHLTFTGDLPNPMQGTVQTQSTLY